MTKKEFMNSIGNGQEDILQGKIWAYSDEQRRPSKRQKDLADIFRLVEAYSHLKDLLPESIKNSILSIDE